MTPKTMKQWTVEGQNGFDSLKYVEDAPVPHVGERDVLVKFHAAALNYRDLIMTRGLYPFGQRHGVVPCSDGAGVVEQVGTRVTRFKPGDRVAPLFNQGHIAGSLDTHSVRTGIGGTIDGTLRQYGAFDEHGLVHIPANLSLEEGATLSSAAVTAWNALYGLEGRMLKPGDVVLTQGTGGVSVFAVQFAKAGGATVIATTSTQEKADTLKKLGADHVINYKDDPNWGETAKNLTPGKQGVANIIDVGGPSSFTQSLKAIQIDGIISIIGFLGGMSHENQPSMLDCLTNLCTLRGLLAGSRLQFDDMNRAIETNNIHPVIAERVFSMEQAKEAYQYMADQKHLGKVCIKIE